MQSSPEPLTELAQPPAYHPGPHWQLRYWTIFIGQALSLVGSALTQFVLIWWITDTTGSVSALAFAGMVALLPQALLGPLGGTLADRYSRQALMIGADAISALCMLVLIGLFLTDTVQLWHIYVMMFIRSAMQAFQAPAAAASTSMLVPVSFLSRAAGLNQSLHGIMTVASAPLGALAISIMPMGWALGIDVLTATLGIVPLLFFTIPQIFTKSEHKTGMWSEFQAGLRLVWQHPGLRRLYALLGGVVLVIMPTFTLVPLLVKEHFSGGPVEVALLEGLAGVGMIVGGILTAILAPRRQMLWMIWGFAISCLTMSFTAMAPGNQFWLAIVWWSISGTAFIMGNGPLTALLQTIIPNQFQGRVLALMGTIMGLAAPIGLVLAIPLGEFLGVRGLFILIGLMGAAVSLSGFLSPALMSLSSSEPVKVLSDPPEKE